MSEVRAEESTAQAERHTQDVNAMFSAITPWYDFQNHAFSLGQDYLWRRALTGAVHPGPQGQVLDVAAGTLDVSLGLLRRFPALKVTAADICEPMLRYGWEKKVRESEKARLQLLVADARALPLEDACMDNVTVAFGIRNVQPREAALKEMLRVLVPGGSACILEFAPLNLPVLGGLYHGYLEKVMPRLVRLWGGSSEAYRYFARSIKEFPQPDDFCTELLDAGFERVRCRPLSLGVAWLHVARKK